MGPLGPCVWNPWALSVSKKERIERIRAKKGRIGKTVTLPKRRLIQFPNVPSKKPVKGWRFGMR